MQKNVASQKWIVFAFNETTNVAVTGDALNITANLRLDGAAANATDDLNPAELEGGYYIFDITAVESNADSIVIAPSSVTSNVRVIGVPGAVWTRPPNFEALGIETDGDLTQVNTAVTVTTNSDLVTAAATAAAVWDLDATAHQTTGTFGQAIGDPGANTETIYDAVVTDATDINIATDIVAVKAETALIVEDTGTTGVVIAAAQTVATVTTTTDLVTAAATAAAVWDLDATAHQTAGTFGQAIGDPGANTETIYDAVVTDATDINIATDLVAAKAETVLILADTANVKTRIPAALVNSRMDATIDATGMESGAVTNILTTAMTESYAANGAAPTLAQAQFAIHQALMQFGIAGTSLTVRKLDDTTTAFIVTLDSASAPTDAKRV